MLGLTSLLIPWITDDGLWEETQGPSLTPLNRVSWSSLICLSIFFSSHCFVQAQALTTGDSRFGSQNASVRHPAHLSLCSPTSPVSLGPSNQRGNGLFLENSSIFQLNPTSSFSCQLGCPSSGSFPWPPGPGQASLPLTPTASSVCW